MRAAYASVCLLSFNRPKLLRQTISTAIKNAHYPFELIVHDDGSDEETLELLRSFHEEGLISLLILNAPGNNEGQGVALNRMFAAATGDPIIKMDHDLELEEDWLARAVELLEANASECDAEDVSQTTAVEFRTPRIGALGLFKYKFDPVDAEKMLIASRRTAEGVEWEEHEDFVGSCMVIPRMAYEEFGPFEMRSTAFAEDAVFKHSIRDRNGWCNALFPYNLATNQGFGLGPSTVNVEGPDGGPVVQKIAPGPLVLDGFE
jgi:glycosyltransferase involved in cell wall biosynthesis